MGKIIRLSIEGMHCDGCVRRVMNALSAVEGVQINSVEVGSAKVVADPARVSPEQIVAVVDRIGFTARVER